MSSVQYNRSKNTIYEVTGTSHMGQELKDIGDKFIRLIRNTKAKDFNLVMDISALDIEKYICPNIGDDPGNTYYGMESNVTRNMGSGKVVIVIDREKGSSSLINEYYKPDAIVFSVEDADHFILMGDGVERDPTFQGGPGSTAPIGSPVNAKVSAQTTTQAATDTQAAPVDSTQTTDPSTGTTEATK